jgi:glycerol-3-phosphate dehydrogenase
MSGMALKDKVVLALRENGHFSSCNFDVNVSDKRIVTLKGEVKLWNDVVAIGHAAAKVKGVRNVVNEITSEEFDVIKADFMEEIDAVKNNGIVESCDVVIIGGGISGCSIARALSQYDMDIVLVEKNSDISEEATKANNGNIHPGTLATPGTLKARLNLIGNKMYTQLSKDLNFELKRPGSLVVFYDEKEWKKAKLLKFLKKTGLGYFLKPLSQIMKVPGLKWLDGEEVIKLEPNLKGKPVGGLLMTTMGIVEPYEVCNAFAENAIENGTEIKLETRVLDIVEKNARIKEVITNHSTIRCSYIINCAGVYADDIADMVNDKFYTIHPRRGAIAIFDKNRKGFFNTPAGAVNSSDRTKTTKGGGASITPEGNMLWGPTATETPYKEDKSVEQSDMKYIINLGNGITDEIKPNEIITYFSGIRAADYKEDFIIEASETVNGFVHVAGIQSPGLASAPAIAEEVVKIMLKLDGSLKKKTDFKNTRDKKIAFRDLSHEEQDQWIKKNPKYGNIVCRCELITEGEIVDAIHSPIPGTTVDGIKRRTRAGMGRCQGGFCGPKVLEIVARELNKPLTEITLKGSDSYVLNSGNRD